jgi:hypothetical protein
VRHFYWPFKEGFDMSNNAKSGLGTLLKIGDGGGSEVFTTIAEVRTVDGPKSKVDVVDVTHMESTEREFIATLLDAGEITINGNYTSVTAQDSLRTTHTAKTKRNFQLVVPIASPETWAFAGFVTSFGPTLPHDGPMAFSATIKLTGAVTIT